jgi:hypothetical protein
LEKELERGCEHGKRKMSRLDGFSRKEAAENEVASSLSN